MQKFELPLLSIGLTSNLFVILSINSLNKLSFLYSYVYSLPLDFQIAAALINILKPALQYSVQDPLSFKNWTRHFHI